MTRCPGGKPLDAWMLLARSVCLPENIPLRPGKLPQSHCLTGQAGMGSGLLFGEGQLSLARRVSWVGAWVVQGQLGLGCKRTIGGATLNPKP